MIRYEIKKIFSKSISKVSLVVLLFSLLISCYFAITNVSFLDEQGKSHTGIAAAKSLREEKQKWEGVLDEAALQAVMDEYKKISEEYAGKQVHLICVLKGGVFFMCELAKRITVPVTMDFMSVSSYGDGTQSSGIVKIAKDLDESLEGKDVIVVEDIVDSGRTLYYLLDILRKRGPKSMKLCTLLDKPDRRVRDVHVDYVGFNIPDEFVVGFGLDYAQKYRNLPYIGSVEM